MKKTLFTSILAIAYLNAAVATATNYSSSNTLSGSSSDSTAGYYGAKFTLDASSLTSTTDGILTQADSSDTLDFVNNANLTLNSITFVTAYQNIESQYALSGSYFIRDIANVSIIIESANGTTIASTSTSYANGATSSDLATITFNFDQEALITLGTEYTITFCETGSSKTRIQLLASYGDTDWYGVNDNGDNVTPSYGLGMTIGTSSIPEPSTATLGLLALTGLMLRRRRHV